MKRTISMMIGKGSVKHNSRAFHAQNTDPQRSYLNRCYCNEPIREIYHQLFDDAVALYNDKQTRNDRTISDYYEKIRSGKQEKLFHEVIFQVGNKDDMGAETENSELAARILDDFMADFQKRNPNLHVFSAYLHMDEATPHLHIDFVPFTTGSTRGLDTRVSLKQALAAQGFTGGTRGDTEWSQWVRSEKEQLSQVMERHDLQWEQLGTHDEHLSVVNFKKEQRTKEVAGLENSIKKLQRKKVDVQDLEQIEVKSVPLSSKVMIERDDYKMLITAAQKHIVQDKKEGKLKKLLQTAEKTITGLKAKIEELTETVSVLARQLDQYRSIHGRITIGSLRQENKELRQYNSFCRSIIEQHGLAHLLGQKKEHQQKHENR